MPEKSTDQRKSQDGQEAVAKKPAAPLKHNEKNSGAKVKSDAREARLVEALRQNLRRRKAPQNADDDDENENKKED